VLFGAATRFLACTAVVLGLGYVMPGFAPGGFSGAIPAAVAASASGYLVESLLGPAPKAQARAVVGLFTCAGGVYLAQFIVPGMRVPVAGALATGLIVGLVDFLVPAEAG